MASTTVAGIPELLHHIFQLSDQQGLARLVRVSVCFHSIAIAYLWPANHLVDLLDLLPEGILGPPDPWSTRRTLERTCRGSDWDRLHHYSVYTTSLVVSTKDCPGPLITFLADKSRVFFPRLRDLVIFAENHYPAADCILFGGQGLRKLEVNGCDSFGPVPETLPYDAHLTERFFRNIITHTPNLTQLKIDSFLVPDLPTPLIAPVIDIFCLALRSLSSLQKLHWCLYCALPNPILTAIAVHPCISDLNLLDVDAWPALGCNTSFFPSLKFVRLVCRNRTGDAFLRAISCPHLLSRLEILIHTNGDPALSFFESFSRLIPLSLNLTTIRLFPGGTISWAQLSPVLSCRLLVVLAVSVSDPIRGLGDQAIQDLASSLTHLEFLHLQSTTENLSLLEATLLGLIPLAQFTPRLLDLSIAVTTRVPDPSLINALLQFQPTTPPPLQQLNLCTLDINVDDDTPQFLGARRTASVISSLWPLLSKDKVTHGWGMRRGVDPAIMLAWAAVGQHLGRRERDGKSIPFA